MIFLNNEKCVFLCFQMASGLQSWVEDHSNITMFNFIAYPIFSKTPWYWLQTPRKTIKGKNSLSLSFSFKRAQLSVTHSATKKGKEKKNSRNLVVSKWTRGENCAFLPWPWSGIVVSETPHRRCRYHQANMSCVLIIHRSEWRLLHDSDLTLYSFLAMFIFVFMFFC